MKTIVLMGNIGCGKSSWTTVLKNQGYLVEEENLNNIRFLQDCWKNGSHCLETQIDFYISWYTSYKKIESNGGGIMDSSIISHHKIFSEYMLETNILTNDEFKICQAIYDAIITQINCHLIYLSCDFGTLKQRIHKRNRAGEPNNDDILYMFDSKMKAIINEYSPTIIDISNMDVSNTKDVFQFLTILKKENIL